ncbi:MAG: hypothetical protein QOH47_385 [Sphingomonadales bacterium]|nr:hypothetical protein [Sphingomonadales bacterium]
MSDTPAPPPAPTLSHAGITGLSAIGFVVAGRQALKAIVDPFADCNSTDCVIETLFTMEEVIFTGFLTSIGLLALPIGVLVWSVSKAWKRRKGSSETRDESPPDENS